MASYSDSSMLADYAFTSGLVKEAFQQAGAARDMIPFISTRDNPITAQTIETSHVMGYDKNGYPILRPFGHMNDYFARSTAPFSGMQNNSSQEMFAVDVLDKGKLTGDVIRVPKHLNPGPNVSSGLLSRQFRATLRKGQHEQMAYDSPKEYSYRR
jgi:hypothetical protein